MRSSILRKTSKKTLMFGLYKEKSSSNCFLYYVSTKAHSNEAEIYVALALKTESTSDARKDIEAHFRNLKRCASLKTVSVREKDVSSERIFQ